MIPNQRVFVFVFVPANSGLVFVFVTSMIPNRRVLSIAAECHVVPAVSFSPWISSLLVK